jgi:hypothetical protein
VLPASGVVLAWVSVGVVLAVVRDPAWAFRAVLLVVSPLWFLMVYGVLAALVPATAALHRRFGYWVVAALLATIVVLDYVRFGRGVHWVGWLNLVVVWSFCHQLGMHYRALTQCGRATLWMLIAGGVAGLSLLTSLTQYPRSMVGVPGQVSNMAPPTLAMAALLMLQLGLALMARETVLRRVGASRRWQRVHSLAGRFSLPLYLFHTSGFVIALAVSHVALGYDIPSASSASWWLERPIWVLLPALATVPLVVYGRRWLPHESGRDWKAGRPGDEG